MLVPSPVIIQLLSIFAPGMTAPSFENARVLICGAILAPGKRTVTSALAAMGLSRSEDFSKYHRILNRAKWRPMGMSRLLLKRLIQAFVPEGAPLVFLIDETLERRRGAKIAYKGWFRDAVRSVGSKTATSLGIRWSCMTLQCRVPWSGRSWALPFLVVPTLSEKTCEKLSKPHRSGVDWAGILIRKLRRWQPSRRIVLVGDGGYAAVELIRTCREIEVTLVARLRWDAKLHDEPGPQPPGKRGRKPKKGARQPSFDERLSDSKGEWTTATIPWYGGGEREVALLTGVSLWHQPGSDPVPLRWVIVRYEEVNPKTKEKSWKSFSILCSDTEGATAEEIAARYVGRWSIEVTFEEMRARLGFETQRQWSVRAIERTTPCLFGLFSLVVLIANALHPNGLPVSKCAWYDKEEATFADALAAVRAHLWSVNHYVDSPDSTDTMLIPRPLWVHVQRLLCQAA
jgi:hypothetical protein